MTPPGQRRARPPRPARPDRPSRAGRGERSDFVAGPAVPLPVIVICELLGVPDEDRPAVRRWSGELFEAGRPDVIDAASHSLAGYMTSLIAAKRLNPAVPFTRPARPGP